MNGQSEYFEGWYFKQQAQGAALSLIPAIHAGAASLQVIDDRRAVSVDFPAHVLDRRRFFMRLGDCTFSREGCTLDLKAEGCDLRGALRFGPFTRPMYDIMGPFRYVPGMECRHSVFSLTHRVDGCVEFNGRRLEFDDGIGYIEGDRGASFPRRYVWTHCGWAGNSVMLSVAEIPLGPLRFIGVAGFVYFGGREYRIATYCGARPLSVGGGALRVRQRGLLLEVRQLSASAQPLRAPQRGSMVRTIHESLACTVRYTCRLRGQILFDITHDQASYEGNWEGAP